MINHNALRAAQNKAVIARFIGDGEMWQQANEEMKVACGYPLYLRIGGFITEQRTYVVGEQQCSIFY